MPTIPQLPAASASGVQDELPVSQGGITRSVTVAELLSSTQPSITLPSSSLLGRTSLGPGGPEAVPVGAGLEMTAGTLDANGGDHVRFAQRAALNITDEVIINAAGQPMRMAWPAARGLFRGGSNVSIDSTGQISASTDPAVSSALTTLGQGVTSVQGSITALNARVPTGGYVALNAQGQITAPVAGPITLGTIHVGGAGPDRTIAARALDTVNVLDFGAQPNGPDCTAAFLAAFNALAASGGEIFVPAGDYLLNSTVLFSGKPVTLRGAGRGISKIHFAHVGIGFDFAPGNLVFKVNVRDLSLFAESAVGATAAGIRLSYPSTASFGYVSCSINEVELFGYPNAANGVAPFPQTFLRGIVLNNCWSTQISNISWFGPPAAAGTTQSAVVELNRAFDTRIAGLQAYFGNAVVLQSGYCEGIYIANPLVVSADYLFVQTDQTAWAGYGPSRPLLLGIWATHGEVNVNLGIAQMANVTIAFFIGLDLSRNGGPDTSRPFFDLTNVSNMHVHDCNFVGGPTGGSGQDVAFNFSSTWNSSANVIGGCHFENMATAIKINGANGTVGLTTYALHLSNVALSTAVIDNTPQENGNSICFNVPASSGIPVGMGSTKDHVLAGRSGQVLFRVNNVTGATNFLRHQPATASNPPTLCFDGSDGTVNGVIQTKGGSLFINASGSGSGSGNMLSLMNTPAAVNWVVVQNATAGNLSLISTNAGGIGLQPHGALWLSPSNGIFAPNLPTSRPASGSSQIWNNGGILSIA